MDSKKLGGMYTAQPLAARTGGVAGGVEGGPEDDAVTDLSVPFGDLRVSVARDPTPTLVRPTADPLPATPRAALAPERKQAHALAPAVQPGGGNPSSCAFSAPAFTQADARRFIASCLPRAATDASGLQAKCLSVFERAAQALTPEQQALVSCELANLSGGVGMKDERRDRILQAILRFAATHDPDMKACGPFLYGLGEATRRGKQHPSDDFLRAVLQALLPTGDAASSVTTRTRTPGDSSSSSSSSSTPAALAQAPDTRLLAAWCRTTARDTGRRQLDIILAHVLPRATTAAPEALAPSQADHLVQRLDVVLLGLSEAQPGLVNVAVVDHITRAGFDPDTTRRLFGVVLARLRNAPEALMGCLQTIVGDRSRALRSAGPACLALLSHAPRAGGDAKSSPAATVLGPSSLATLGRSLEAVLPMLTPSEGARLVGALAGTLAPTPAGPAALGVLAQAVVKRGGLPGGGGLDALTCGYTLGLGGDPQAARPYLAAAFKAQGVKPGSLPTQLFERGLDLAIDPFSAYPRSGLSPLERLGLASTALELRQNARPAPVAEQLAEVHATDIAPLDRAALMLQVLQIAGSGLAEAEVATVRGHLAAYARSMAARPQSLAHLAGLVSAAYGMAEKALDEELERVGGQALHDPEAESARVARWCSFLIEELRGLEDADVPAGFSGPVRGTLDRLIGQAITRMKKVRTPASAAGWAGLEKELARAKSQGVG